MLVCPTVSVVFPIVVQLVTVPDRICWRSEMLKLSNRPGPAPWRTPPPTAIPKGTVLMGKVVRSTPEASTGGVTLAPKADWVKEEPCTSEAP